MQNNYNKQTEILEKIRHFLAQGKEDEAIKLLLEVTKDKPLFRNKIIFNSNSLEKIKKADLLGISSDENNKKKNKIIFNLINITDSISSNHDSSKRNYQKKEIVFLLSLICFLLILTTNRFCSNNKKDITTLNQNPIVSNQIDCPLDSNNYNILLYKFNKYRNGKELYCEKAVADYISKISLSEKIKLGIKVSTETIQNSTFQTLNKKGKDCNTHLQIWGNYEEIKNSDSTFIQVKYFTIGVYRENEYLANYYFEDSTKVLRSISSLASGVLNTTIKGIVYWALGIKNFEKEDYNKAIDFFSKVPTLGNKSTAKKNKAIADCYVKLTDFEKALKYYQLAIKVTPLDQIAKNNISVLEFIINKKQSSLENITVAVNLDSVNPIVKDNFYLIKDEVEKKSKEKKVAIEPIVEGIEVSKAHLTQIRPNENTNHINDSIVESLLTFDTINHKKVDEGCKAIEFDESLCNHKEINHNYIISEFLEIFGHTKHGTMRIHLSRKKGVHYFNIRQINGIPLNKGTTLAFNFEDGNTEFLKFETGDKRQRKGQKTISENYIIVDEKFLDVFSNCNVRSLYIKLVASGKYRIVNLEENRMKEFRNLVACWKISDSI